MKRLLGFLRSMRFANILLAAVALCCGLSSLLPQGNDLPYYAENYPRAYLFIYRTHLYDIFRSWYFILLVALLCLSMLVCTVSMLRRALRSGGRGEIEKAAALPDAEELDAAGLERLRLYMASLRCKEEKIGQSYVFHKNGFGRWGTFLIHLSILLTVVFGAMALYLPRMTDLGCRPGESITLEDGTRVFVDSFSMYDEAGTLDYSSMIRVTLPDGRSAGPQEIRVNYPMTFGNYKIFQWTYGTEGAVAARAADGSEDRFTLDEASILSVDGDNRLEYLGLYEATPQDGEGESYLFYEIRVVRGGVYEPAAEFRPGESVSLGGIEFEFLDPHYPGLRIKTMPVRAANSLLEAAFVLMLVGLFITFYLSPVLVKADEKGYTVAGPRAERRRLELKGRFARDKEAQT